MEGVFLTPGSCWDSDITFLALISHEGSLLFEASTFDHCRKPRKQVHQLFRILPITGDL